MSQNNSNDKTKMLEKIEAINAVDGFDPAVFAVDYVDLATNETRKRLPVMIQMAWFGMKYPEGRIAVQVTSSKDCFIACARIYPSYKDSADCYLAEATASRKYSEEKPSISPREWAQTAAVGIALRNAGFGLQFAIAGEDFSPIAPDELGGNDATPSNAELPSYGANETDSSMSVEDYAVQNQPQRELTPEERLHLAMTVMCPITKYNTKTLGEVLADDPKAIKWLAEKFSGNEEIKAAAKLICDYAIENASA